MPGHTRGGHRTLVAEKLTKRFGEPVAVDMVSFTVDRPMMIGIIGIIGATGAGKSTFLRMMNRLTDATMGVLSWEGRNVHKLIGQACRQSG